MTADAAIAWAEKNLSADEYESIFGKVSEEGGSDKVIFTARVPKFVWASLKRKADAQGISVPSYIYTLLEESVDK